MVHLKKTTYALVLFEVIRVMASSSSSIAYMDETNQPLAKISPSVCAQEQRTHGSETWEEY